MDTECPCLWHRGEAVAAATAVAVEATDTARSASTEVATCWRMLSLNPLVDTSGIVLGRMRPKSGTGHSFLIVLRDPVSPNCVGPNCAGAYMYS